MTKTVAAAVVVVLAGGWRRDRVVAGIAARRLARAGSGCRQHRGRRADDAHDHDATVGDARLLRLVQPSTVSCRGRSRALPTLGTVLRRGQQAFEVDGTGVYLFYGARPAWRPFIVGMPPGADILELEQNLAALGFGSALIVDDTFTWQTQQAIRAWQLATGQTVTGTIELGRITFAPTALRVVTDAASLGSLAQPGQPILTASSPNPIVTVPVPATQTYLVHRHDRVTVTRAIRRHEYRAGRRHLAHRFCPEATTAVRATGRAGPSR